MGQSEQDAEARLRWQIEAYHEVALAYTCVKLGLPEVMGTEPWSAEQLAMELGLSPPHLHRFLRALAAMGLVEESLGEVFTLTQAGQSLLAGSPSRLREKVLIVVEQYWQPWANLAATLETGQPSFDQVFGTRVGDWRRQHSDHGATFDTYVALETLAQGDGIVAALDLAAVETVADIGGGYGALLACALRAHPHLTGALIDRHETLVAARPFLQSLSLADRIDMVGADISAEIPVQADLYLLRSVLQQLDDDGARAVLTAVANAMPMTARACIIEPLLPQRAADDPAAAMVDLHMMAITGGRARSLAEFEALLADAGLAVSNTTKTVSGADLVEAVRT
jgi:O-methyltransferase domain